MRPGSPNLKAQSSASSKPCLSLEPKPGEPARPKRLMEAMRYATLGGGKRLRPFLTVETARALGRTDNGPKRAGAAIECIHAYSLIHDDLPAMDDDDLRRGRPTTHRAFDEATAILAGDGLQALAFEILADPATDASADVRVALCLGLARAAGLAGMVGGQQLDIDAEKSTAPLSVEEIRLLQAMKTGALLKFSVEAGAILAGAGAIGPHCAWSLRARNWGRVSDRRRHSRRRKRRGDARQTRRQGRRAEQGHPGRIAGARRRAPRARPPGGRGDLRGRCGRSGRQGRHLARDCTLRRRAEEVRARRALSSSS